jgi:hypothetical protein
MAVTPQPVPISKTLWEGQTHFRTFSVNFLQKCLGKTHWKKLHIRDLAIDLESPYVLSALLIFFQFFVGPFDYCFVH